MLLFPGRGGDEEQSPEEERLKEVIQEEETKRFPERDLKVPELVNGTTNWKPGV